MEYLEGKSLENELIEHPNGFDVNTFCPYIKQITSALSYAHRKGVIHRDLKPSNIFVAMVEGKKIVKILDFGIAKTFMDEGVLVAGNEKGEIIGVEINKLRFSGTIKGILEKVR